MLPEWGGDSFTLGRFMVPVIVKNPKLALVQPVEEGTKEQEEDEIIQESYLRDLIKAQYDWECPLLKEVLNSYPPILKAKLYENPTIKALLQ
jgi:hypothetical protein